MRRKKEKNKTNKDLSADFIRRGLKSDEAIKEIYQDKKKELFQKPQFFNGKLILIILLLTIIFGFLSGFTGGFLVLISRKITLPFKGEINLDQYLPKREMTIETIKNVTVTPDVQINDIIKSVRPQIVAIYQKKEKSADVLKQIYQPEEILGQGIILTSDGWIISLSKVLSKDKENYLVIDKEGQTYSIKKILFDPLTEIVFFKIEGKNLPVVKLASKEETTVGQGVILVSSNGVKKSELSQMNSSPLQVQNKERGIKSVEKFSDFLKLSSKNLDDFPLATPVINLSGAVIGLKENNNFIVPTFYLRNLITQVLKNGDKLADKDYLERPSLGVRYLDLARSVGIYDKRFKDLREGALIYGKPLKNSPAAKAGIKNSDVIIKVNEDNLSKENNLSELIWQYEPGSTLKLVVLRNGERKKLRVVLDKIK